MYYVYLLKTSNGQIYKGVTGDLKRRFAQHERGEERSTSRRRLLTLVGYEAYLLKSDAVRRERFLKTTEGRRLLHQQYRDVLEKT